MALDTPRLGATGQVEADLAICGHAVEHPVVFTPVAEVTHFERSHLRGIRAHPRTGLPHPDQRLRILVRQRPEENRVNRTEDRGIHADAEREGDDDHQGESRPSPQAPHRVLQVRQKRVHILTNASAARKFRRMA